MQKERPRRNEQLHGYTCKLRKHPEQETAEDYFASLYLYRELNSEAIRILLPLSEVAYSEQNLHSFIAALNLGLRAYFRGDVHHLEVTEMREPASVESGERVYLVIYDRIPGGTGYLKELMRTPDNLIQVLALAHQRLIRCACIDDEHLDGCYRCILAYRDSRNMATISRKGAAALLADILALRDQLEPEDQNDLMIVGDGRQRIYGRKASLSQCGINIRGRGRKLRINYRTTEQIRRYATAVLEGVDIDDLDDGHDPMTGYRSRIEGQAPVVRGFASEREEAEWVVGEIERLLAEGTPSAAICVVGRTAAQLNGVLEVLGQRGLDNHAISRNTADDTRVPGVRLANMHRIKGLGFRAVFLVGVRSGVLPLAVAMAGTEDPVEQRHREQNERALLHVAGTRAMHSLYVTWSGEPSPLLKIGN